MLCGVFGVRAATAVISRSEGWTARTEPFRIADGLYYVGSRELAAYLITTSDGDILLDGGVPSNATLVISNIHALGFDPRRVRVLLNSHAHFDHAGALAGLKQATGAALYASPADAALIENGGRGDFTFGNLVTFPRARVDHLLADGEQVKLGDVTLTAHFTPGHTKGCTSWSGTFRVGGQPRQALFICSMSVLSAYRLIGDPNYPRQAGDYEASFAKLRALPCELFLGPHGSFFDLLRKQAALKANPAHNPFVDPAGCRRYVDRNEAVFRRRLALAKAGKG